MKSIVASAVFCFGFCAFAVADEAVQSQRFSIVQAQSRTILLDHVSGTTWVLQESPSLRWQEVPKGQAVIGDQAVTQSVLPSEIELVTETKKSVELGKAVLVRAKVTNPTSAPREGITVSLALGQSELMSATAEKRKMEEGNCVWEIGRLDAGASKTFEAQIRFSKATVGRPLGLTWSVHERSGKQRIHPVQIAVVESE